MRGTALMEVGMVLGVLAGGPGGGGENVRRRPSASDSFVEQWGYIRSRALFNAVMCSRRSGKTHGAVDRHVDVLTDPDVHPGSWTHFGSLIRRNARKHFFNPLQARLDGLGWRYEANATEMILRLENGNYCQAFSCDDMSGIKAPQGDGSALFTIDECHLPLEDVTKALVEVATPMLTDRGGMLDLLGLPPEVEGGYFSRVLDDGGFRVFGWTMFDHDFPRPRQKKLADVIERCKLQGLTIEVIETMGADGRPHYEPGPGTHPLVMRQYFGRRVKDPEKFAYEYRPGRNDYDPAGVDFTGNQWRHAMGIDLGFQDRDAIVVVAWRRDDGERRLYVRHCWQDRHQDVDQLAVKVREAISTYHPGHIVGDTGGHGAVKVIETLKNRMGIMIEQKPTDVMLSVGLVNDDLRTGRLLVPRGSELCLDLGRVQRSVNPRTKRLEINKQGYHSDLTEALRYAHHSARHFRGKEAAPPKTRDQLRGERMKARRAAELDPWNPRHFARKRGVL